MAKEVDVNSLIAPESKEVDVNSLIESNSKKKDSYEESGNPPVVSFEDSKGTSQSESQLSSISPDGQEVERDGQKFFVPTNQLNFYIDEKGKMVDKTPKEHRNIFQMPSEAVSKEKGKPAPLRVATEDETKNLTKEQKEEARLQQEENARKVEPQVEAEYVNSVAKHTLAMPPEKMEEELLNALNNPIYSSLKMDNTSFKVATGGMVGQEMQGSQEVHNENAEKNVEQFFQTLAAQGMPPRAIDAFIEKNRDFFNTRRIPAKTSNEKILDLERQYTPDEGYLAGLPKVATDAAKSFATTLDGARQIVADIINKTDKAVGLPNELPIKYITDENSWAKWIDDKTKYMPTEPKDNVGETIRDLGQMGGFIGTMALAPEVRLAGMAVLPKIATAMGANNFVNGYYEARQSGNSVEEALKKGTIEGTKGTIEGLGFETLGMSSKKVGEAVESLTKDPVLKESAAATLNALGFGGLDVASQYTETGKVDWKRAFNASVLGGAFHAPQLAGEMLGSLPTVNGKKFVNKMFLASAQRKALENFLVEQKDIVDDILKGRVNVTELRDHAMNLSVEASGETDKNKKYQTRMAAATLRHIADVYAVGSDVATNPQKYIDFIKNAPFTQEEKDALTQRINETYAKHNPIQKLIQPIADKIKEVKDRIDYINNNKEVTEEARVPQIELLNKQISDYEDQIKKIITDASKSEQTSTGEGQVKVQTGQEQITEEGEGAGQSASQRGDDGTVSLGDGVGKVAIRILPTKENPDGKVLSGDSYEDIISKNKLTTKDIDQVGTVDEEGNFIEDTTKPKAIEGTGERVPAVRTADKVFTGKVGESHNDIIETNNLTETDIKQRGFVDEKGNFESREEAAKNSGLPTKIQDKRLHSSDLISEEQRKENQRILREDIDASLPKKLRVNNTDLKAIAKSKLIKGAKTPTVEKEPILVGLKKALEEVITNPTRENYNKFAEAFEKTYENPYRGSKATKELFDQLHKTFPELKKAGEVTVKPKTEEEGKVNKKEDEVKEKNKGNKKTLLTNQGGETKVEPPISSDIHKKVDAQFDKVKERLIKMNIIGGDAAKAQGLSGEAIFEVTRDLVHKAIDLGKRVGEIIDYIKGLDKYKNFSEQEKRIADAVLEGYVEEAREKEGTKLSGISHRLRIAMGLPAVDPAKGWSPDIMMKYGKTLLQELRDNGTDPYEYIDEKNKLSDVSDKAAVRRALADELNKNIYDLKDKADLAKGEEKTKLNKQIKELENKREELAKEIAPYIGAEGQKILMTYQGETDFNTNAFTSSNYIQDLTKAGVKRELTASEKETAKRLATEYKKYSEDKSFVPTADKLFNAPTKVRAERVKIANAKIAEGIDELFSKAGVKKNLLPEEKTQVLDSVKKIISGLVEKGEIALEDAVKFAKEYINKNYPNTFSNEDIDSKFPKEKKEKDLKSLQGTFAGKTGNKFTHEQARDVWNYAKQFIDEKGLDEALRTTANDLGLNIDQVRYAIATPKGMREITEKEYVRQKKLRDAEANVKAWVQSRKMSNPERWWKYYKEKKFEATVLGHGGVWITTHAGTLLYQPSQWHNVFPTWIKSFNLAYGKGAETNLAEAIQDHVNDPLYAKALKSGSQIDPVELTSDEYLRAGSGLGKFGRAGTRGFFGIKQLRFKLWKDYYNSLSDAEKSDEDVLKGIADLSNYATGAIKPKTGSSAEGLLKFMSEVFFAPRLVASVYAGGVKAPSKSLLTGLKMVADNFKDNKTTTAAEKAYARIYLKTAGEKIGFLMGALAINQGMQTFLGGDQKINAPFMQYLGGKFDPTQNDFLKFKMGGRTLDVSSGVIPQAIFVSQMLMGEGKKGERPEQSDWVTFGKQFRYKLAPSLQLIADFVWGTDAMGRPLPDALPTLPKLFGKEIKPYSGQHRYESIAEYLATQLPIPAADMFQTIFESFRDNGMSKPQAMDWIKGLGALVVTGGTGAKIGYEPKDKSKSILQNYIEKMQKEMDVEKQMEKVQKEIKKQTGQ